MKLPYENTLIGFFLYSLGYYVAQNNYYISRFSPNLLQQTPADKELGDLLISSTSQYLLIEFKRSKNELYTELSKKRNLIECMIEKKFYELSSNCHYLSYGETVEGKVELVFIHYLAVYYKNSDIYNYELFFNNLLNNDIGVDKDTFLFYLEELRKCSPDDPTGPGGPGRLGNFAIIEITENAELITYDISEFKEASAFGTLNA
jgi:hypothetical protein